MNCVAWIRKTVLAIGGIGLALMAWTSPALANSCADVRAFLGQGYSLAEVADALGTTVSVVQHACLQPRVVAPSGQQAINPAGRAPISAAGPAPLGAAGPAPWGAAGPAPLGAAGPAPFGAPGPAPIGAAGKSTVGAGSTTVDKTR